MRECDLELPKRRMAPTQKNLIGKGMPTQARVDDEGCSGSRAPVSSPSVEKETTRRQESENHTPRVRDEGICEEEIDSST